MGFGVRLPKSGVARFEIGGGRAKGECNGWGCRGGRSGSGREENDMGLGDFDLRSGEKTIGERGIEIRSTRFNIRLGEADIRSGQVIVRPVGAGTRSWEMGTGSRQAHIRLSGFDIRSGCFPLGKGSLILERASLIQGGCGLMSGRWD